MKEINEGFGLNILIENVNLALRNRDLSLAELLGLYSLLEVQIVKSPKNKFSLKGKLNQIERRILNAKSSPQSPTPRVITENIKDFLEIA